MRGLCLLVIVQMAAFGAEHRATAADVVKLVFTSLYSDHNDAQLAQKLDKVRLGEQLDRGLIPYFRNLCAGPQTLAALQQLRDRSERLRSPADRPLAIQPIPKPDERAKILARLFTYAQRYVRSLPNFICDQVTSRFTNFDGVAADGSPRYKRKLRHSDNFTRSLRFVNGAEEGHVEQVNGENRRDVGTRPGQSVSSGEFGGDMVIIFGKGVEPEMQWDHWELLNGERRAVLSFFVGAGRTKFSLFYCCYWERQGGEMQQSYNAPIRGLVYENPDTGEIARLMIRAVNLPSEFRIKESNTIIDYGRVSIGDKFYTMPVAALMFLRTDVQENRNEIAFVKYRKFEAESVLTFTDSRIVGYGPTPKE